MLLVKYPIIVEPTIYYDFSNLKCELNRINIEELRTQV